MQARVGGRQPFSIYTDRRLAAIRAMRPPVVYPRTNPLAGLPPAGEGVHLDALVLQRVPQPFDEEVVEEPTSPIHGDAHPASLSRCVHAQDVNWLP